MCEVKEYSSQLYPQANVT